MRSLSMSISLMRVGVPVLDSVLGLFCIVKDNVELSNTFSGVDMSVVSVGYGETIPKDFGYI